MGVDARAKAEEEGIYAGRQGPQPKQTESNCSEPCNELWGPKDNEEGIHVVGNNGNERIVTYTGDGNNI